MIEHLDCQADGFMDDLPPSESETVKLLRIGCFRSVLSIDNFILLSIKIGRHIDMFFIC